MHGTYIKTDLIQFCCAPRIVLMCAIWGHLFFEPQFSLLLDIQCTKFLYIQLLHFISY